MLTIAVTLRSEPAFRTAIIEAGMDGVMAVTGKSAPATVGRPDGSGLPRSIAASNPSETASDTTDPNNRVRTRPRDAVPVNRFGAPSNGSPQIQSILQPGASPAPSTVPSADPTGMASDIGRLLQNLSPGR